MFKFNVSNNPSGNKWSKLDSPGNVRK